MNITDMFVLPRHVTGYTGKREAQPAIMPYAHFEACCLRLAQGAEGLQVQAARPYQPGQGNHHVYEFLHWGQPLAVLCNAFFPLVAFAHAGRYCNMPGWEAFFPDFTVLGSPYLHTPLDSENEAGSHAVQLLSHHEFAQFAYREPQCLGEVVFHHWD